MLGERDSVTIVVRPTINSLRDWVSRETILTQQGLQLAVGRSDENFETLLWQGLVRSENGSRVVFSLLDQCTKLGIVNLVENELLKLGTNYPSSTDLFVDIWPMDPNDDFGRESLRGISATTGRDGVMSLVIDPTALVINPLRETVIHEYHHHLRHEQVKLNGSDETLLSRLIFEGLAEHFVVEVLGHTTAPWIGTVSDDYLWSLWPKYQPVLELSGKEVGPYLFGDPMAGLPKWSGYAIGFLLVRQYRQIHPDISMHDLTVLSAEAFVSNL
jgi:uncharacterized protein YjaZ